MQKNKRNKKETTAHKLPPPKIISPHKTQQEPNFKQKPNNTCSESLKNFCVLFVYFQWIWF